MGCLRSNDSAKECLFLSSPVCYLAVGNPYRGGGSFFGGTRCPRTRFSHTRRSATTGLQLRFGQQLCTKKWLPVCQICPRCCVRLLPKQRFVRLGYASPLVERTTFLVLAPSGVAPPEAHGRYRGEGQGLLPSSSAITIPGPFGLRKRKFPAPRFVLRGAISVWTLLLIIDFKSSRYRRNMAQIINSFKDVFKCFFTASKLFFSQEKQNSRRENPGSPDNWATQ